MAPAPDHGRSQQELKIPASAPVWPLPAQACSAWALPRGLPVRGFPDMIRKAGLGSSHEPALGINERGDRTRARQLLLTPSLVSSCLLRATQVSLLPGS